MDVSVGFNLGSGRTSHYGLFVGCVITVDSWVFRLGIRVVGMDATELVRVDRAHVWHPYAPMPANVDPYLVESASGVRLRLADGRELVDGMASWWAAIHGYRHPELDAAAHRQIDTMSHVMFGGLTHEPAVRLASTLVELTPPGLDHVFLADSGSVSVEVAIKMCLQYWKSLGHKGKTKLLTWRRGYHGDTFHPMSVCDPDAGMHSLWRGVLPEQVFVDAPPTGFDAPVDQSYVDTLEATLAEHADSLAAVIVEPIVQNTGGIRIHAPGYLRALRELTERYGVLLILDEIATGFWRTGECFAAEHAGITPDVMCVGKALTGGYLTAAAALCTPEVADGISQGELPVLAHGPTFMANPLSCAVANASLDLLQGKDMRAEIARITKALTDGLAPLADAPGVRDVRVLGAIGAVQLERPVDMAVATEAAVTAGVWLRPFGDLVYTMPPYVCTDEEIARICAGIAAVVAAHA
jgi:adenosylmethionine-8-amino-7-oxononanoate aminotransferase